MAMTVYIGSMCMIALALPCELRNRHENWASSSKHGHHHMRRRLESQLQSFPWRQSSSQLQQRAGRLRVNCSSSTADPARDSRPSPIPTLYDFLEISQHVGLLEIKVAYRQMVRRYHPDVCPPTEREECTRRFLQVQEAYDTLSDPHLRADYDLWLQNPLNTRSIGAGLRAGNRRRTGVRPDPDSTQWKDHWESQLSGLHNRSAKRESWASRMRRKRDNGGEANND